MFDMIPSQIPNIIEKKLLIDEEKYKIIPSFTFPVKQCEMKYTTPNKVYSISEYPIFEDAIEILRNFVDSFVELYGDTHAFAQPRFYFKPYNEFIIVIDVIEKSVLEEIENNHLGDSGG